MDKTYKDFAIQIVMQAVHDYKHLLQNPALQCPENNLKEIELFFVSNWCKMLTEIDMVKAMEYMKREAGVEV